MKNHHFSNERKFSLLMKVFVIISVLFLFSIFYNNIINFFKTTALVTQLLPSVPIKPLQYFSEPPIWQKIEYTSGDSVVKADLILPSKIKSSGNPAVLFSLGIAVNEPTDDQRLVNLSEALARLGIIVLIPWTDTQKTQFLSSENEVNALVNGFKYLNSLPQTKNNNVGIIGYCTGASMGLIAATNQEIRNEVSYVVSFAGYHDLKNFSKSILSDTAFLDSNRREWVPDPFAVNLVKRQIINTTLSKEEAEIISSINFSSTKISDIKSNNFSLRGNLVVNLLNLKDHTEISNAIDNLPEDTLEWLNNNSPSSYNSNLAAPVFIMHDKADNIVPYEESYRMYRQISQYVPTEITIFDLFQNEIQLHENDSIKNNKIDLISNAIKLFSQLNSVVKIIFE